MKLVKPSLAKGTRDFSSLEVHKRNYIFNVLKDVFRKYGYTEIQTPSFENLQTLTGKYGEEGDRLIFKILKSGDYLSKADSALLEAKESGKLTHQISDKALRYDLTIPFARYVVMNRGTITMPFKRFQIQPVWRADRPQRGRYREFFQCDVDVVGTDSLIMEAEFVLIYVEALKRLGLKDFHVKLNNRKILAGIAETIGESDRLVDMTVAIDKLDKIGFDGVSKELLDRGFIQEKIDHIQSFLEFKGDYQEKLSFLEGMFTASAIGSKGVEEVRSVFEYLNTMLQDDKDDLKYVDFDVTLARGLDYYTGCIFEVKTNEVKMGSIGGGGRYDNLTGVFGWKDVTGVGVSFGADRIYDVLEELNLFPEDKSIGAVVLLSNFDQESERMSLRVAHELRGHGVSVEVYPKHDKMKRQLNYANSKQIPFVIFTSEQDIKENNKFLVRNMITGEQDYLTIEEFLQSQ